VVGRFYAADFDTRWVCSLDFISIPNTQVRVPKNDSWYEYAQNCAEYLE
jgi:hypothetical protein